MATNLKKKSIWRFFYIVAHYLKKRIDLIFKTPTPIQGEYGMYLCRPDLSLPFNLTKGFHKHFCTLMDLLSTLPSGQRYFHLNLFCNKKRQPNTQLCHHPHSSIWPCSSFLQDLHINSLRRLLSYDILSMALPYLNLN